MAGTEPGLTCIELVELVTDYLEGGLDDRRARAVRAAHRAAATAAPDYLDQMRVTIAVVGRIERGRSLEQAKSELLAAFRGWAAR